MCVGLSGLLAGCGGTDVNAELGEALRLAELGDTESWKAASKKVETCIDAGRTEPDVLAFQVMCLQRSGQIDKAKATGRDLLRVSPENFTGNYLMGKMLTSEGNNIEALDYLRRAHELKPSDVDALVLLARCAGGQNVPEADKYYLALMTHEEFANSHLPYNELAIWYVQQGRYPEAMSYFSQALQKQGANPQIYLNMAVMQDKYFKKPKVARRFYTKFLTEAGESYPEKTSQVRNRLRTLFVGG
jgi:tetratricopeptide (TPR) repeat protein